MLEKEIDHLRQRILVLETRVNDIDPTDLVDALRGELVGAIEHVSEIVARDLSDHRRIVAGVEERATKADRFVRRVIIWAGGAIGGSIIAAVLLIYAAGAKGEASKAEAREAAMVANEARIELLHKIDKLETSLTDLQGQVKLLLEARIGHPP